jgi:hypothetical protein
MIYISKLEEASAIQIVHNATPEISEIDCQ